MSDNRTMEERGFKLENMTDHEFAAFVRKNDLTHAQHLIGVVYSNRNGETMAVVKFDNENMSRDIWVK